jgi:hypothetical protein
VNVWDWVWIAGYLAAVAATMAVDAQRAGRSLIRKI